MISIPASLTSLPLTHDQPVSRKGLLPYRNLGDPLADEVIESIFGTGESGAKMVHHLLKHLVRNDHPLATEASLPNASEAELLPPAVLEKVEDYFSKSDALLTEYDEEKIRRGEAVFQKHGPEILMILATYSLPASYTAVRGAAVLAQTGRLESDAYRRLIETTQMVIDVMAPGGLRQGASAVMHGKGLRSAQKVRLMHAAIRRLVLERHGTEWIEKYGVPINQMDLVGTLMTFSSVIFQGLEKLRVRLSPEEKEAYLYAWQAVGRVIGIRQELIPESVERADELRIAIRDSELGKSPHGIALTEALVHAFKDRIRPRIFSGLPISLMRRFLGDYSEVLELPKPDWTASLVSLLIFFSGVADTLFRHVAPLSFLHRILSRALVGAFLLMQRGGNRPAFNIPTELADGWGLK